uniref:NAD(P)/FAD-dependent oxidoreductase n=1 Tax=candidate division WOR-3 bacterium TaxID=2052148 RepID=A0A7C4YF12_UNCW3
MKKYDIIVVGAGISGVFFSKLISESGAKVLVIERKKRIGEDIHCAEGVSKKSISDLLEIKDKWISSKIEGSIMCGPDNTCFKTHFPDVGWILDRSRMEEDILLDAVKNGVDVITRREVVDISEYENGRTVILNNGASFLCELVVGADGISSFVGRRTGILKPLRKDEFHITYQYFAYTNKNDNYAEFYFSFMDVPGGYFWNFPKGEGFSKVGLGIDPSLTDKKPKEFLDNIIKKRFDVFKPVYGFGSGVPTTYNDKLVKDGVALIGDGGRLTDPITGGGIANALRSAMLLAQTIKNGDLSLRNLRKYEEKWNRTYGKNNKWGWSAKNIFRSMRDDEIKKIAEFGIKVFHNRTINDVKHYEIIKGIIKEYPEFIKWGIKLLKGRFD